MTTTKDKSYPACAKRTAEKLTWAISAVLLGCIGHGVALADEPLRAYAELRGCTDPSVTGAAVLTEEISDEGVKTVAVSLDVLGLAQFTKHAVHIHEVAACDPCSAAQGHFDPGPNSNSNPDGNHPFHAGDLVNLEVDANGIGTMLTKTTRVTLSPGPLSVFDDNGSAFIVHVNPDSYCPDGVVGGCAGGARAACGIIKPAAATQCVRQKELKYDKDKFKAKLVNVFNDTLTVNTYQLSWPSALGDLREIKIGGKKVFNKRRPPPTTFISEADFIGKLKDRQIKRGGESDIEVKFSRKADNPNTAKFASVLTTVENCLATTNP